MLRLTQIALLTVALGILGGLAGNAPAEADGVGDLPKARLAVRMHVATPALVEVVIGGRNHTSALTSGTPEPGPAPGVSPTVTMELAASASAAPAVAAPAPVVDDLLHQSRAAGREGNWPQSLAVYRQVLQAAPSHPDRDRITLETAAVLERLEQNDEALQLYERLLAETPAPPLAGRARLGRSTLRFRREIQGPDPLPAFTRHARELAALNSPDHLSPEDRDLLQRTAVQAWDRLLTALKDQSELPVARLEEIITLWDQSPVAHRAAAGAAFWADRLHRAGLFREAARFYQSALEAGAPTDRSRLWTRWVDALRELGDWRQLETVLSSWSQEAGELPPRHAAELGRVQLLNGASARAAATLEAALAQDEAAHSPENWLALAQAHQQLQDEAQAIRVLERALLQPLPREALQKHLAALYDRAGRYDQAAGIYQKLLPPASPGDRAFYLERLGVCYAKTHQYPQAHQIFRELAHSGDGFWQKLAQAHLQGLAVYADAASEVN